MSNTPPGLSVLSYNIHKGFNTLSTKLVLNHLKEALEVTGAELLFLQEVVGENSLHASSHKDWPKTSQFEYLADTHWPHFAYGKNAVYDVGHHGNAILSKFPILASENIDISGGVLDRRGILHAVIGVPLPSGECSEVHCLCTHLGLTETLRKNQLLKISERISSQIPHDAPLILAGDFNDWRGEATRFFHEKLGLREVFKEAQGRHVRSFPAYLPLLRLDRIYVRGFETRSVAAFSGAPWRALSDHIALFARLSVRSIDPKTG